MCHKIACCVDLHSAFTIWTYTCVCVWDIMRLWTETLPSSLSSLHSVKRLLSSREMWRHVTAPGSFRLSAELTCSLREEEEKRLQKKSDNVQPTGTAQLHPCPAFFFFGFVFIRCFLFLLGRRCFLCFSWCALLLLLFSTWLGFSLLVFLWATFFLSARPVSPAVWQFRLLGHMYARTYVAKLSFLKFEPTNILPPRNKWRRFIHWTATKCNKMTLLSFFWALCSQED